MTESLPYRERGTVPSAEEHDPLTWALERLQWDQDRFPPDFHYDCDLPRNPIHGLSNRVIKALITHMIRNADYDGLTVAMTETYSVFADQETHEDRIHFNERASAATHTAMLTHVCSKCQALPGDTCVTRSGTALQYPHARRGALR